MLRTSLTAAEQSVDGARPDAAASNVLAIVALSEDPLLLEALTGAAIEQAAIITSPSADRFIDQLVANAASVALIDAAAVAGPVPEFIAMLHEQFPNLSLILAGQAHLQHQFTTQIADGTVFRFAHKPASAQRLKLFVDAASRRRHPLDQNAQTSAPGGPPSMAARAQPKPAQAAHAGWKRGLGVGFALVLIAALAAAIAAWRSSIWHHTVPAPVAASAPGTSAQPRPANATNSSAPGAESLTGAGRPGSEPPPAGRDEPDRASADGAERDRLLAESQAREAALLEQVRRTASGARVDQAHVYLQLARRRLESGALLEPADDSAHAYVDAAQALAPDDPDVRATSVALAQALMTAFRNAIAAGDANAAQRWLQACGDFRINAGTLSELGAELEQLQAAQRPRAQPPANGSTAAPPAVSAAATQGPTALSAEAALETPAPAASTSATSTSAASTPAASALAASAPAANASPAALPVVPESSLQREHFTQPVYPPGALERGLTGWVDLEFTVTGDGSVKDVQVMAAEPRGVFEEAATLALQRSRYRPVLRDGVATAQRSRVRLRFALAPSAGKP